MRAIPLQAGFVEKIHDELLSLYFPNVEPVSARDFRSRKTLEAAVDAPYAMAFGMELFPSIQAKTARLF